MPHKDLEEVRYKWRGFAVVDDAFEDSGVSLNADRIADWWLAEMKAREEKLRERLTEKFGKDGGPALVIIEDVANNCVEQRPALDEVLALLTPNNL